jgi:hypothetical protein
MSIYTHCLASNKSKQPRTHDEVSYLYDWIHSTMSSHWLTLLGIKYTNSLPWKVLYPIISISPPTEPSLIRNPFFLYALPFLIVSLATVQFAGHSKGYNMWLSSHLQDVCRSHSRFLSSSNGLHQVGIIFPKQPNIIKLKINARTMESWQDTDKHEFWW